MSDYEEIMKSIMAVDLGALEEIAGMVADFPTGKDDFIQRHWITNAIDCGDAEVVEWMLQKKAPVVFKDEEGYTVLHSAIEREHPDKYRMMKQLIEAGADVNAHGVNDWTPAHQAAVRNDVEALQILHRAGADFTIRTRIDESATPLEEAAIFNGAPDAIEYLKKVSGPDMIV